MAQQKNVLINSGELIRQSNELQEKSKYKEAMALLQQISRSDTGYADALYELSYCAIADSQHRVGYDYAMEGIRLFPERKTKYVLMGANALDDLGKSAEAVALYTEALATDPHSYILYFNRGITQYRMDKLAEATADFETAILMNPYYASSHYYRGKLYMVQGKLVPGILAYQAYLMVAPDGRHKNKIIADLLEVSKVTDAVRELAAKNPGGARDPFAPIQDILLSKIALDKQYKLKADLEDNIVRQLQVVNEQLQYTASDKSFAMQVYVPLFEDLFKQNHFEAMIFTLFSGLELEKVNNWLKKNKKEATAFSDAAAAYLSLLRGTRELDKNKRSTANVHYLFEEGEFAGKGLLNNRAQSLYTGEWTFFHDNGAIKSKGRFNETEKKEGEWLFYHKTGGLKERAVYSNGKQNGPSEGWHANGNSWYKGNYVNDEAEGTQYTFFYNGNRRLVSEYKNGKKNGPEQQYSYKGYLTYTTNFVNDLEDGKSVSYHPNGQVAGEVMVKADKKEGIFKSWYPNGKLESEGNCINDKRQGLWITYYKSGGVKEKTTYKDNEITGEFTEYFENGVLSRKGNYTRKKPDGKMVDYDEDGKMFSESVYDNGKLREINYFDKTGKQIAANSIQKNASSVTFYSPMGEKLAEGFYTSQGDREGKYSIFYPSGKLSSESQYEKGQQAGAYTSYFNSGQKNVETSYTADEEDGYSAGYYFNGRPRYDGWMVAGQRQQVFNFYNNQGELTTSEYYLDNELDGWTTYYNPGKKPTFENKYTNGWLDSIVQYDSTGKIMSTNFFKGGKGPLVYKHYNGKTMSQGQYDHYALQGPYTTYYFDGGISGNYFYKNGELDSVFKDYYHGGKLRIEGQYKDGKSVGTWKYYYADGKLKRTDQFVDGERNGETVLYSPQGAVEAIINLKGDELHGEYKIFGDNKQLIVNMLFKEDAIVSYTYEGKDGKLVEPIPMAKGSGKVTAYYQNGSPSASFSFADNLLHGDYTLYYSNGKTFVTTTRANGTENGKRIIYYPDGKVWKEDNFILGNYNGNRKTYHPNGKLSAEEWYYDDEEHGTCKYYNEQGQLTQTKIYYYGILQAVR